MKKCQISERKSSKCTSFPSSLFPHRAAVDEDHINLILFLPFILLKYMKLLMVYGYFWFYHPFPLTIAAVPGNSHARTTAWGSLQAQACFVTPTVKARGSWGFCSSPTHGTTGTWAPQRALHPLHVYGSATVCHRRSPASTAASHSKALALRWLCGTSRSSAHSSLQS